MCNCKGAVKKNGIEGAEGISKFVLKLYSPIHGFNMNSVAQKLLQEKSSALYDSVFLSISDLLLLLRKTSNGERGMISL